jgi:nucleoside-diphosphate-sugar epimerase
MEPQMKVLVTGGAGRVGRWVVRHLAEVGHDVLAAGRSEGQQVDGGAYTSLDVTDFSAVRRTIEGCDAVVHLAALPAPERGTSSEVWGINSLGTYHVYQACVDLGVRRLAVASSINALGMAYGVQPLTVRYFPLDEEHPARLSDPYSFSKHVTEEIGDYFWQKDGLSSVCIRIPWVVEPIPRYIDSVRHSRQHGPQFAASCFWATIDSRDSARIFAAGIEVEYEGSHRLFANDDHNILGLPSRELVAAVYPYVTDWRAPMEGDEALVSCERAKAVLGWEPVYSWQGVAAGGSVPR